MKSLSMLLVIGSMVVLGSATLSAQAGTVTCMDGSPSAGGRGACSSHGGIMTAAAKAKAKADAKMSKRMEKAADKKEKAEDRMVKADAKADAKEAKMADKAEDREMKGAIAECKDHTYSHAKTRRGVCSSHGGVAKYMAK